LASAKKEVALMHHESLYLPEDLCGDTGSRH
jgi:hypothetical protein